MTIHVAGVLGLVAIFVIGTIRPVNLGVLAIVMTFLVGSVFVGEPAGEMVAGFPIDLFVLLVGVTYLFGVAATNGTVERVVDGATHMARNRRALVPWIVFAVAAAAAMAGAIGSAGVALLAPLAMRLAESCEIDRRLTGLMVHVPPGLDAPDTRAQATREMREVYDGEIVWGEDPMELTVRR